MHPLRHVRFPLSDARHHDGALRFSHRMRDRTGPQPEDLIWSGTAVTLADLGIAFGFGLFGSIHCAQMCGPFVLSYSLATPGGPTRLAWAHACYNLGRLLTYTLLGMVAGALGGAVASLGTLAGIEKGAMLVSGILMVVAGVVMLGAIPKSGLARIVGGSISSRMFQAAGKLLSSPEPASKFGLGLLLGFLPCGLLWAALLKAGGTGSPLAGGVTMLAFGIGTTGALVALGAFSSMIGTRFRRYGNVLAGAGILLVGALLIWRGIAAQPLRMGGHSHDQ